MVSHKPRILRVAASQFRLTTRTSANLEHILFDIEQASKRGVDVVVFPELALCGYPPDNIQILDYVDQRETEEAMERIQERAKQCATAVVVGAAWTANKRLYNRAFLISAEGTIIGTFDKLHLFREEPGFFSLGEHLDVFEWNGVRVAMVICYDMRFPAPWRALRLQGAQVVFLPVAGFGGPEWKLPILDAFVRVRASENQMFVVSANTAGPIQTLKSVIYDPDGLIVAQANYGREELIVADLDLSKVSDQFLRERRTDVAEVVIRKPSRCERSLSRQTK